MKRTTITLPEDLARAVAEEARRRGTSVSEVIRRSVRERLVGSGVRKLAFQALFDDPRMTPAAELEEDLARLWADDLDRRRR